MTKAKAGGEQPVEIPDTLPILPLRNSVLFPGAIIPIDVGRRKSVRLVEDAIAKGISTRRRGDAETQKGEEEISLLHLFAPLRLRVSAFFLRR